MKRILNYKILAALIFCITACDNGFDELNTSPVNATKLDPIHQLNFATLNSSYGTGFAGGNVLVYDLGIVQQIITPNSGVVAGANANIENRDAASGLWQNFYRNVIKNTRDVIRNTKDDPSRSNLYNMARIFQAYAFMTLTDEYGDIPYFEAGQAYPDRQMLFPKYDAQEAIYQDIINELTQASAAIDPTRAAEPVDLFYGGDRVKWKKFGYSLLLRAGMRLSKVNPALAQSTVQAAFQGGVMTSNDDNAMVRHDANNTNAMGNTLNGSEAANFYLAKAFVDQLKNTNDPRLSSIAVRYIGSKSGGDHGNRKPEQISRNIADQFGMPLGFNNNTINAEAAKIGLASFYDFSQADRTRVTKRNAPMFLVTAAQTQLLLAEARTRGWITTGTAEDYYNAGVRLHMGQMAQFDAASAVAPAAIDAYLAANPFNPANALEQINTQYWIASFLNGPEAFANFRRSGYPQLPPNPLRIANSNEDFIRRLIYPNSEISINTDNVNAAVARMGGESIATRVWWDRP